MIDNEGGKMFPKKCIRKGGGKKTTRCYPVECGGMEKCIRFWFLHYLKVVAAERKIYDLAASAQINSTKQQMLNRDNAHIATCLSLKELAFHVLISLAKFLLHHPSRRDIPNVPTKSAFPIIVGYDLLET